MLYNLDWLAPGKPFPPLNEETRITRYCQNEALFDSEHFADPIFRHIGDTNPINTVELYNRCAQRIERVVGNFDEIVSFPVILNYQRLMSLKMADLICGEPPSVTGKDDSENTSLREARDRTDFDSKLYATAIDLSRFGDAIWRIFKDDLDPDGKLNFTCWDPKEWYPIIAQDGTNRVIAHCIAWRENRSTDPLNPDYYLHVQIHRTTFKDVGSYEYRVYHMDRVGGAIGDLVVTEHVPTGLKMCAVMQLRSFATSTSVYGYDDYVPIDSLLAEIMERVAQISAILDKHADPSITGPASMLTYDAESGEMYLKKGNFFAVSPGEDQPKYMVWDGHLDAAFKQLELLLNQLYILSEMGAALLGGQDGSAQAVSGTAMRFKLVNPLAKARRVSNSLRISVRRLFSTLCDDVAYEDVGVEWFDGLPDDPMENAQICKLVTGATKMMPLKAGIREYFNRTDKEAENWIDQIQQETIAGATAQAEANTVLSQAAQQANPSGDDSDPNKPGPQDGTGVNPQKNISNTGLKKFKSDANKHDGS